ncbi:MAG: GH3 auxin-responsive promoter family protein [Cyanobacteriota/Melainabacteria group bacterium]
MQFVRIFDQSLRLQNPEYEDKRSTKRLGEPVLKVLPPGTYTRLRQQRVMEGAGSPGQDSIAQLSFFFPVD